MKISAGGFTLIELLISIPLYLLILLSVISLLLSAINVHKVIFKKSASLLDAVSVMNTITGEIRQSKQIDPLSSTNKLIVDFDTYIISYDYNNGKIRRTKNTSSQYLSADGNINSLLFSYPSAKIVKFEIKPCNSVCILTSEVLVRND